MFKIVYTNKYNKDLKKVKQNQKFNQKKLDDALTILSNNILLNSNIRAHKMLNKKLYNNSMNIHICNDIILLYNKDNDSIYLNRIGTHSYLLGNEKCHKKSYKK